MGLTQNQDTIKTLKMVIFLIIIEMLFFMSSVVMVYAESGKNTYNKDLFITDLKVSDFQWHDVLNLGGGAFAFNVYSSEKGGVIRGVAKGDMVALQKAVDERNALYTEFNTNQGNTVDTLNVLFATLTFGFLPFPLNLIPVFITTIIGLIIAYFLYTEIKSWIPDWL